MRLGLSWDIFIIPPDVLRKSEDTTKNINKKLDCR